jgi:cytidyltransferase-like protein
MGWMCDRVVEAGGTVIADFICPTPETRAAFGDAFIIWVNRIEAGRFEDTNRMFVAPDRADLRIVPNQPFHPGHQRLIEEGLRRVGQVCIAVRDTHGIDEKNPLPFFAVKQRIEAALSAYAGRFVVVALPNITHVFCGRDVGYMVERIVLDEVTEEISATKMRRLATHPGVPET